jgi:hypothetical protein
MEKLRLESGATQTSLPIVIDHGLLSTDQNDKLQYFVMPRYGQNLNKEFKNGGMQWSKESIISLGA